MMRLLHVALRSLVATACLLSVRASFAQGGPGRPCEQGDWFCEPATPEDAAVPPSPARAPALSPPQAQPDEWRAEPTWNRRRHKRHRPALEPADVDGPHFPPPGPRPRKRGFQRYGLGIHVLGALMGNDRAMSSDAAMGGVGATFRYHLVPEFALEAAAEAVFGTDYNGHDRQEGALLFHGVGFLNPRSIARVYVFAGLGVATAHIERGKTSRGNVELPSASSGDRNYGYVGADVGAGVELRLMRHAALSADILGLVRGRTDSHRERHPEFTNPDSGQTTNTSGAGLVRIGAMFYW